uniref:SDR family NAD(P)-dependent oxidoreductase n=1 Tax=Streptomyces sp. NRRL B-24085 TaxID=1709476 RepID=UPI00211B1BE0
MAVSAYDLDAAGLHETAALIKDAGGTVTTHALDVTDREQLHRAITSCERLDVLAAIAGIMHSSPVLETRDEDLDRVLNVNFKGVLHACQEAARLMLDRGTRGSIVTMASGAVDTGGPGLLCYGAA